MYSTQRSTLVGERSRAHVFTDRDEALKVMREWRGEDTFYRRIRIVPVYEKRDIA